MSSGDEEGEEAEDLASVDDNDKRRASIPRSQKSQDEQRALALGAQLSGDASTVPSKPQFNLLYVLQQGRQLRSDFRF